jgi:YegS/Rv2252/BmrU family lipid kinase
MQTLIIFNPYSGRGAGLRAKDSLCAALKRAAITFDMVETEHPGHAILLAHRARIGGYTTVVAAGGDGTISEVVNGLMQASLNGASSPVAGTLGVLPIGSGNDFATMAGVSRNLDVAAERLALAKMRVVDVGTAHYRVGDGWSARYFNNNMGVGLEAAVILESNKIRKLRGIMLYATAAVRALIKQKSPYMDISWELEDGEVVDYEKHTLMVSVGNGPRAGGGFYLTPDAKMDDDFLDVAIAKDISRPAVLALLPRAMFGKHTGHHAVTMLRVRKLHIAIPDGAPMQMDGEIMAEATTEVEIGLLPQRLQVIV